MKIVQTSMIACSILLSGCVAPRTFDILEQDLQNHPVRATFAIPPPCDYIAAPESSSALIGTWSVSGTTDGVDYSPRHAAPIRWSAPWSRSFTFYADGSYSATDSFNGHSVNANGRWSYQNGSLVLDIGGANKTNTHREFRLLWIDGKTFDLRWSSDTAEAAWWKYWVLDQGKFAGWDNSVVVTYDRNGCKRQTSRMRRGTTGVIYDVLAMPLRYKCTSGGGWTPSQATPTVDAPRREKTDTPSNAVIEIDAIPL